MKNRIILLAFIFTVAPAFSQQSSSSASPTAADQGTSSSQSGTASGKEPLGTRGDFWEGDEPGLAALVAHPFASKAYVRRNLQPIQDRVNELDEITASQAKMIRDVDTNAQHGIKLASDKAQEADQHATDAGNKAQRAQEIAAKTNTRLATVEPLLGNIDEYKSANQTEIRFRRGQSGLSKDDKQSLDEVAELVKGQHGYVIEVQGFYSGARQVAIAASRRIADSVVRYLVLKREIPAYRIYVIGMGNIAVNNAGEKKPARHPSAGRVEVSVLKNDLDQWGSNSTPDATTSPK
jgi:outer membrane protein OmpA-like peptidoglycan-associated protein